MNERLRGRTLQDKRKLILKRDNGLCIHCLTAGRATIATEVDHITPLHKGGTYDDDNLQSLCHACHATKTARDTGKKARNTVGIDGYPIGDHHWNR